jgi:putative Mn2+ efflux pump MntP
LSRFTDEIQFEKDVLMNLLTVIFLASSLAMDAFAVSITLGTFCKSRKIFHSLRVACAFGFFQAMMPILGWLGGLTFRIYIQAYDHWIAFALLSAVGLKMIYESFSVGDSDEQNRSLSNKTIFVLAIATSIDALAVGITFSFGIIEAAAAAVLLIGIITFGFSFAGFHIGDKFGHFFESNIERIGGVILIGIGLKILI